MSEFAQWKGIQDSIELWIPRRGFRILCQKRIVQNPTATTIPDSSSFILYSKSQNFGFHRQKFPEFGNVYSLTRGGWMVTFEIHSLYILPTYDINFVFTITFIYKREHVSKPGSYILFSLCLIDIVPCWSYITIDIVPCWRYIFS